MTASSDTRTSLAASPSVAEFKQPNINAAALIWSASFQPLRAAMRAAISLAVAPLRVGGAATQSRPVPAISASISAPTVSTLCGVDELRIDSWVLLVDGVDALLLQETNPAMTAIKSITHPRLAHLGMPGVRAPQDGQAFAPLLT